MIEDGARVVLRGVGEGENRLGLILMRVRAQIIAEGVILP